MSAREKMVKRRTSFLGLPVNIEIEAGETRSGIGDEGEKWEKTYAVPYGEIDKTIAPTDGDPVDVYLGAEDAAAKVYVVHQLRKDRSADEDKVMLGFPGPAVARAAYELHGPPWGFGSMDEMTLDQFVHGYLAANRAPALRGPLHNTAAARQALGQERYGS